MATRWVRSTAGALMAALALTATGCSDDTNSPSDLASKAASAASRAGEAVSDASAAANRQLDKIKGGVDAKGDVKLSDVHLDGDGHATAKVTVSNSTGDKRSYAVEVNFNDKNGDLVDVVVLTVNSVPAGGTKTATAHGRRSLSGQITADVGAALRY
ncbi:hypothetical protein ACZ90_18215 [Streptomyces albus subsp. albus]|nr:hypothetical protein ACZ90_18215 [Streptomyces albus subsp. albus]